MSLQGTVEIVILILKSKPKAVISSDVVIKLSICLFVCLFGWFVGWFFDVVIDVYKHT